MPKIIVVTTNPHKLREIRQVLHDYEVESLDIKVRETGQTFAENAIKKAKAGAKKTGQIVIADDSGLMVNSLQGAPGVRSARFASPPTASNLCTKLIRSMAKTGSSDRRAKFVCVIAIVYPSGRVKTIKGECRGSIIQEMRGQHGFGYDPVFVPQGYKKTFAQMAPRTKNRISHRGRVLKKLCALLTKIKLVEVPEIHLG